MSLLVAYIHWSINLDRTKMCCPVLMCWRIRWAINQSINVYLPNTNISDNINVDNIKYGAPWEQCQKKEIIK